MTQAQYVTGTQYAGITKEAYADDLEKMPFEDGLIQEIVPFEVTEGGGAGTLGNQYHQPVMLTMEHGVTYNGTAGNVVTLNQAIAGTSQDATIIGVEVIFRSRIGYKLIATAAAKGPKAFRNATQLTLENLNDTGRKRTELSILYGQGGLGQVTANNGGVLTISDATWSAGTWVDMENANLEAWTGITSTETQHNGTLTITAVDIVAKTVTVTGTNSAVVANDWLYFAGARTATAFNEMLGIASIFGNTSATVFGISATSFSRWKGNLAGTFGPVSMGKILEQIANPVNRGFKGKLKMAIPTRAFEVLNTDLAALRRLDSRYEASKGENGFESLLYHHQRGTLELFSHPLVRDGDAFAFNPKVMKRIGSSDLRFGIPGSGDGDIFFNLQDNNAYEARLWTDQAMFVDRPAHCIKFTGITYS